MKLETHHTTLDVPGDIHALVFWNRHGRRVSVVSADTAAAADELYNAAKDLIYEVFGPDGPPGKYSAAIRRLVAAVAFAEAGRKP